MHTPETPNGGVIEIKLTAEETVAYRSRDRKVNKPVRIRVRIEAQNESRRYDGFPVNVLGNDDKFLYGCKTYQNS